MLPEVVTFTFMVAAYMVGDIDVHNAHERFMSNFPIASAPVQMGGIPITLGW